MPNTPDRVILYWPDTDLSIVLNDDGNSHMVFAILEEIAENPFQRGQDLTSDDTIIVLVNRSGSSGTHDPERELYVGVGGMAAGGAHDGDAELARRLQEDFDAEPFWPDKHTSYIYQDKKNQLNLSPLPLSFSLSISLRLPSIPGVGASSTWGHRLGRRAPPPPRLPHAPGTTTTTTIAPLPLASQRRI